MEKHFTTSVYIIHEGKVLLLLHPKLKKWLPSGGHIEQNETPIEAARREVREETGLEIEIIKDEHVWIEKWNACSFERPYLCLIEEIPPFKDKPAHQHIDLIYLARPLGAIELCSEEPIRWFSLKEVEEMESDVEIFDETQETIRSFLRVGAFL